MNWPPLYLIDQEDNLKKPIVLFIAVILMAFLASCGEKRKASQKTAVDDQVKVLATVNGVTINEFDLKQRLSRVVTGDVPNHEVTKNVLQTLVRDELIYQKSIQLGLDKKKEYLLKLNAIESQLRAFQRQEMSNLYRAYVQEKAAVTDSEAQQYFDKNAKMIQTKFHVLQIFYKGKYPEIVKDEQDLKSGIPFEKVAARRFGVLPKGMKAPWDLGQISWSQMPNSWLGIVDRLEPGKVTDIIKGDNDRFWVIKLLNKTVDTNITFTTEKEKIVEVLSQQKANDLYKSMLAEMQGNAKIVYTK